ncbi:ORF44 [White spot syndrome virus]|uniref:ORF44 n=1 Tax=White spot syndrome virus TaxID=342409 RepID=A0A2D3I595_9VIRU|nr:ORF44 [White spot syndrome virus]
MKRRWSLIIILLQFISFGNCSVLEFQEIVDNVKLFTLSQFFIHHITRCPDGFFHHSQRRCSTFNQIHQQFLPSSPHCDEFVGVPAPGTFSVLRLDRTKSRHHVLGFAAITFYTYSNWNINIALIQ